MYNIGILYLCILMAKHPHQTEKFNYDHRLDRIERQKTLAEQQTKERLVAATADVHDAYGLYLGKGKRVQRLANLSKFIENMASIPASEWDYQSKKLFLAEAVTFAEENKLQKDTIAEVVKAMLREEDQETVDGIVKAMTKGPPQTLQEQFLKRAA